MISENYTVQKKKRSRIFDITIGWIPRRTETVRGRYEQWCVIDKNGRIMVEGAKTKCELVAEVLNRG